MNALSVFLWCALALESSFFIASGILIYKRQNKRVFKVRSPKLFQISHWSNFIENFAVIYDLETWEYNKSGYFWVGTIVTFIHFLTHYLFFIPFLLRSYRLYKIFNIGMKNNFNDKSSQKDFERIKERYLLKVLIIISLPFVLICITAYIYSPMNFLTVKGTSNNSTRFIPIRMILTFLIFLEQLSAIFVMYGIRNVNDDFSMTKELMFVSFTWIITSPNNIFGGYSTYSYQILLRNNLVFLVSSIYPLYKSYKVEMLDLPLTEEVLSNIVLILDNQLPLQFFEVFLKRNDVEYGGYPGLDYLDLWMKCEYMIHNPSEYIKLPKIVETLNAPQNNIPYMKEKCLEILENHYFPLFKDSQEYNLCLKEIHLQNLYNTRACKAEMGSLYSGHKY